MTIGLRLRRTNFKQPYTNLVYQPALEATLSACQQLEELHRGRRRTGIRGR